MQTKVCTVCGEDKPLDQYRKYSGRGKFGLRPLCKVCQRKYESTWRSRSKENRKVVRAKRAGKAAVYAREYRVKKRAFYLIGEARRRCKRKNIPFDLDQHVAEIQERIDRRVCEVTGIPLEVSSAPGRRFNTPSLDRINPKGGYVLTNVRIVAFAVNAMMGDWGEETALYIAKQWVSNDHKPHGPHQGSG